MSDQEYVESRYRFFDTVLLAVRALVQVVLGGAALGTIVAVALILGAVIALDLCTAFTSRAVYGSGRSLEGRTVRLTGFVTHRGGGTWYVTRLLVPCCAAEATTNQVRVRGADAPATDTCVRGDVQAAARTAEAVRPSCAGRPCVVAGVESVRARASWCVVA
ncbi:hypothetical protein [Streptomyces sp. NPDC056190]|uniref:hypothetical protein n=1 Tax=Streptomyces sp. NPDC056190 TaxID=3345741 RepID=UPI0035D922FB